MTTKSKTVKTSPVKTPGKPAKPAPTPAKKATAKPAAKLVMSAKTGKLTVKSQIDASKAKADRDAARAKRFPSEAKAAAAKAQKKSEPKAAKVVIPEVPFVAATLTDKVHALTPDARPTSGKHLYAHTKAALHALGMMGDKCPAAPERALVTILGSRAVMHHVKENNMAKGKDNKVSLTPAGLIRFRGRRVDNSLANAYGAMFATGKAAPILEVPAGKLFASAV